MRFSRKLSGSGGGKMNEGMKVKKRKKVGPQGTRMNMKQLRKSAQVEVSSTVSHKRVVEAFESSC